MLSVRDHRWWFWLAAACLVGSFSSHWPYELKPTPVPPAVGRSSTRAAEVIRRRQDLPVPPIKASRETGSHTAPMTTADHTDDQPLAPLPQPGAPPELIQASFRADEPPAQLPASVWFAGSIEPDQD